MGSIMLQKEYADSVLDDLPTNYVGSKRKILPWMGEELIKAGVFNHTAWFVDMFGGSGIVSYYLASLGLRGVVNDLMISSHFNHMAMFSDSNPADEPRGLPLGVELVAYEYIPLDDIMPEGAKKSDEDDLFADDEALKASGSKVSCNAIVKSRNNIFTEVHKIIKNYVLIHFTAKEAFELACYITNAIMHHREIYDPNTAQVVCLNYDAFGLMDYNFKKHDLDPATGFVYIDPPYGGASSNYHKIYSIMECIAFAAKHMQAMFDTLIEGHEIEDVMTMSFAKPYNVIDKNMSPGDRAAWHALKVWPHDVEELPHIKQHAWRFNTTDKLDFKVSFDKLISKVTACGFRNLAFSFNKDSSWASEVDLVEIFQKKFGFSVVVAKTDYRYAYRTVNTGSSTQSMGNMTVGQDTADVVGKRQSDSEEILFICQK